MNQEARIKFSGIVKKHLGRGTKMGFPTANINAPQDIEDATYLALTNNKPSMVFIGAPETFEETDRRAESYILDFSGDLYGQVIEIEIIKKLRDNQKFDSEADLIEQMNKDERLAREFFANYNINN